MEFYEGLYYKLFAAIADAVELLEQRRSAKARELLIGVMRDAEETVISVESPA